MSQVSFAPAAVSGGELSRKDYEERRDAATASELAKCVPEPRGLLSFVSLLSFLLHVNRIAQNRCTKNGLLFRRLQSSIEFKQWEAAKQSRSKHKILSWPGLLTICTLLLLGSAGFMLSQDAPAASLLRGLHLPAAITNPLGSRTPHQEPSSTSTAAHEPTAGQLETERALAERRGKQVQAPMPS